MKDITTSRGARRWGPIALALTGLLTLGACGPATGNDDGDPAHDSEPQDVAGGAWPRTVELDGRAVQIGAEPQNIVALSTETGDIALELAGPDRVRAVSAGSVTEGAGNAIELAEQVESALPSGTTPEPENILALEPDLVLMTGRHDGEDSAAEVLESSGVPTLTFDSADFNTPQAVADSVRVLGHALGVEQEAEEHAAAIEGQLERVHSAVGEVEEQPRVLGLMARGESVMITGTGSSLTALAELAGGVPVAAEEGWRGTVPADAELILATEPDVILVEDFRGAGRGPFEVLLGAEALADVPAIAGDQVHLVPSAIASGSAGLHLGEGLIEVAGVLHPDEF